MRIGFDAKRAFNNFTGLGNYSRDTIRILSSFYTQNDYFIYTPIATLNQRLKFLENQSKIKIRSPEKILDKLFSSFWRTKNIINDLKKDKLDIYHGLSHELPIGIENTKIKSVVTIHDLIYLRHPNLFPFGICSTRQGRAFDSVIGRKYTDTNKVILKLTVSLRFRCFIFLQLSILHASFRRVYEDPGSSYRVVADGDD